MCTRMPVFYSCNKETKRNLQSKVQHIAVQGTAASSCYLLSQAQCCWYLAIPIHFQVDKGCFHAAMPELSRSEGHKLTLFTIWAPALLQQQTENGTFTISATLASAKAILLVLPKLNSAVTHENKISVLNI